MHGLSSSAHPAQFSARHRWFAIVTVFACVVFPAAHARGALLFAEWATIDATSNTASGSIGPVAVTFSGNDVSGGVTDNSFTGFNNAVFAPPLPASDSVNFVTTLSRYIWTITFAPAVTNPRLHLFSHASVLNFLGIPLTKLSGQDSLVVDGSTVIGELNSSDPSLTDANGTVQLNGTFTSVIFTAENFFGNDESALQIGADVVPDSISGDYNGNNEIDAADYTVWRDALTAGSTTLLNDPTPDVVDESDFLYWRDHFGEMLGGGAGAGSAAIVPEPSTLAILLMAALSILPRRAR